MMGSSLWKILIVAFSCAVLIQALDFEELLSKVPEEKRVQFLTHHITLGYQLSHNGMAQGDLVTRAFPQEFSIALYEHAIRNHKVVPEELSSNMRNVICFPNGECVDVGDVGVHPKNQFK